MADLFQPPNAAYLRDQFLRDLRLGAIDANLAEPPTQPGTDWYLLGDGVSNISILGFANLEQSESAQNILTATGDDLEELRIAEGLPEVPPAPATGKIVITVLGATTLADGQKFLYPNGKTGKVVGTYVGPANGTEVNAIAIDTGSVTNLGAGETVRFISPPVNIAIEAKVSTSAPLTGGTDEEKDDRKRDRILNSRRNKPAGGNWAHLRQMALDALGSVQDCYVYPALGGPGSGKVVPVKDIDPDNLDFSRTLSSTALGLIRAAIQSQMPNPQQVVIQAANDSPADFTLQLELPASALSGGNGEGWTDATPWPPLVVGDAGRVSISSVGANLDALTLTAGTSTAPVDGLTHVSWFSSADRKVYTALVTGHSGSAGAWVVNLDRPLVDKTGAGPTIGDLVSPTAQNIEHYAATWIDIMRKLGPGENTADPARLPRAKRHPFTNDEDPSSITRAVLGKFTSAHPEMSDIAIAYASPSAPAVPANVKTAPNILIPRSFAIYSV